MAKNIDIKYLMADKTYESLLPKSQIDLISGATKVTYGMYKGTGTKNFWISYEDTNAEYLIIWGPYTGYLNVNNDGLKIVGLAPCFFRTRYTYSYIGSCVGTLEATLLSDLSTNCHIAPGFIECYTNRYVEGKGFYIAENQALFLMPTGNTVGNYFSSSKNIHWPYILNATTEYYVYSTYSFID